MPASNRLPEPQAEVRKVLNNEVISSLLNYLSVDAFIKGVSRGDEGKQAIKTPLIPDIRCSVSTGVYTFSMGLT